ncbi:MAG TPA: hypothetical protein VK430_01045 [Xanthobacteraceae bacterium]|nr:hypothetical protein [Xanthobacteraceae bacterium]
MPEFTAARTELTGSTAAEIAAAVPNFTTSRREGATFSLADLLLTDTIASPPQLLRQPTARNITTEIIEVADHNVTRHTVPPPISPIFLQVRQTIETADATLRYLPPCSPGSIPSSRPLPG